MVRLELDDEEVRAVGELVWARLRELPREISHTAHRAYRDHLKHEQQVLESLLLRLEPDARAKVS